ncbi:MAG TPA: hypothetical protein VGL23_16410 [Chloroflexota bacterium]
MAQFLREQGRRAYALAGGLVGWEEADYPLEPKSAEQGRTVADVCPDCGRPLASHRAPSRR